MTSQSPLTRSPFSTQKEICRSLSLTTPVSRRLRCTPVLSFLSLSLLSILVQVLDQFHTSSSLATSKPPNNKVSGKFSFKEPTFLYATLNNASPYYPCTNIAHHKCSLARFSSFFPPTSRNKMRARDDRALDGSRMPSSRRTHLTKLKVRHLHYIS
jgi:hypothetical protein